ncbi:YceD family protein [Ilumatobacter sp.]|uniref:YceD family protein n=1 Tax=Ilumatobacter sp. TaxID=1967498 RepID=UPI003B52289D
MAESSAPRALRVNALELLRQPGTIREIEVSAPGDELDVDHEALDGDVVVGVRLESLTDGITVRGAVVVPWSRPCRRCLTDLAGESVAEVDELYQVELIDEEAFEIVDNQLDLAPMARQSALLELDDERVCRVDCAGLCPECGADLNVTACGCDTEVRDDRWAALDGLVLDD